MQWQSSWGISSFEVKSAKKQFQTQQPRNSSKSLHEQVFEEQKQSQRTLHTLQETESIQGTLKATVATQ